MMRSQECSSAPGFDRIFSPKLFSDIEAGKFCPQVIDCDGHLVCGIVTTSRIL
jgi:hypothetical protein